MTCCGLACEPRRDRLPTLTASMGYTMQESELAHGPGLIIGNRTHQLWGEHTGTMLGDTSKGASSHVLDEGEVGWERLIAIRDKNKRCQRAPSCSQCSLIYRQHVLVILLLLENVWLGHFGSHSLRCSCAKSQLEWLLGPSWEETVRYVEGGFGDGRCGPIQVYSTETE